MAYRSSSSGRWPEFFTDNDLNALINVWGAEIQRLGDSGQTFVGENYREVVEGGHGDDHFDGSSGDDKLVGFRGFDMLNVTKVMIFFRLEMVVIFFQVAWDLMLFMVGSEGTPMPECEMGL